MKGLQVTLMTHFSFITNCSCPSLMMLPFASALRANFCPVILQVTSVTTPKAPDPRTPSVFNSLKLYLTMVSSAREEWSDPVVSSAAKCLLNCSSVCLEAKWHTKALQLPLRLPRRDVRPVRSTLKTPWCMAITTTRLLTASTVAALGSETNNARSPKKATSGNRSLCTSSATERPSRPLDKRETSLPSICTVTSPLNKT
mmetsp:Transcript_5613/g.13857  ORF Transcript_5613/g.13857 Transcript_5613/m.13857 type:complete len:200 (-) Transcript_5613:1530-2129(-)